MITWFYLKFFSRKHIENDIRLLQEDLNLNVRFISNRLKSIESDITELQKEKPRFTKEELEEIADTLADSIKELVEKEVEEQMAIAMSEDIIPNTDEIAENVMEAIVRRLTS